MVQSPWPVTSWTAVTAKVVLPPESVTMSGIATLDIPHPKLDTPELAAANVLTIAASTMAWQSAGELSLYTYDIDAANPPELLGSRLAASTCQTTDRTGDQKTAVNLTRQNRSGRDAPIWPSCRPTGGSVSAAELRQQPKDLDVEPNERHHQSKGAVPLHILGCTTLRAGFDEVEIED